MSLSRETKKNENQNKKQPSSLVEIKEKKVCRSVGLGKLPPNWHREEAKVGPITAGQRDFLDYVRGKADWRPVHTSRQCMY